jgi:glycosyltransferase involved in cell wall biosynthesis
MPGRTDNVPLYLSIMDVFVLPAWWEGFGNVLVEAAAMGIPVISTKGTGTRDAVSDGFNGILVDVKNATQLASAMFELKENKEKRIQMGKNGIEWAKNFNSERIWEGMKELYLK